MLTIWLDEPPVIEVENDRATIMFNVNGDRMAYTMRRATLRTTVEFGKRDLDAVDRRQQNNIVQLRRQCPLFPGEPCS